MERDRLVEAGPSYSNLRGLLMIPAGALFFLGGAAGLEWGPFGSPWLLWVGAAVMAVVFALIYRHYRANYGKVTLDTPRQAKDLVWTFGGAVLVIVVSALDATLDFPINGYVVGYALLMIGYGVFVSGIRAYHLIIWGALLAGGLLPVWSGIADEVAVGMFPMGVATIASGAFDHLRLVSNFGSAAQVGMVNGNE